MQVATRNTNNNSKSCMRSSNRNARSLIRDNNRKIGACSNAMPIRDDSSRWNNGTSNRLSNYSNGTCRNNNICNSGRRQNLTGRPVYIAEAC